MNRSGALAALAAVVLCTPLAAAHASEEPVVESQVRWATTIEAPASDVVHRGPVVIEAMSGTRRWVPLEVTGLFSASDLTAVSTAEREQRVERDPQSTSSAETPPVLGWLAGFMVLLGAGCVVRRRHPDGDANRAPA